MPVPQEVILSTSSSTPFPYAPTSLQPGVGSSSSGSKRSFAPPAFFNSSSASASSSSASASSVNPSGSITLHDLTSGSVVSAYKPSSSALHSVGYVQSRHAGAKGKGMRGGGGVFAVQEGKGMVCFWAWQKWFDVLRSILRAISGKEADPNVEPDLAGDVQQVLHRIHLPEKLSCFTVSPNGIWAIGGSGTGHVYLWEIASGLLLASFDAAYRRINVARFSPDSSLIFFGSEDSSISVYSVIHLVDNESAANLPTPFAVLGDHTLAVTDLWVGKGSGVDCRVWSTSLDGTCKIWSLNPPTLLTSFSLPTSQIPTCLTVDPLERYFYVGTSTGAIHRVALFRRRREIGASGRSEESDEPAAILNDTQRYLDNQVIAVGGKGLTGSAISIGEGQGENVKGTISLDSPISCISLSLSQSHILAGTASGHIHVHALPSHQLVRTITAHVGSPVTHLHTILKPADTVGGITDTANLGAYVAGGVKSGESSWPIMEIRTFERMRIGRKERDQQEISLLLRPITQSESDEIDNLDTYMDRGFDMPITSTVPAGNSSQGDPRQLEHLEAEVAALKAQLSRAKSINDQMWNGVVEKLLDAKTRPGQPAPAANGSTPDLASDEEGDTEMIQ